MPKRNRDSSVVSTPMTPPPQLCPEPIRVWAAGATKTTGTGLSDLAKSHLLATGWSLFQARNSTGKLELRYRSPAGKAFYSLRTACRSVVLAESSQTLEIETASTSPPLFEKNNSYNSSRSKINNKRTKKRKMRSMEDIMKDERSMMMMTSCVVGRPTPVTGRGDLYWTLLKSELKRNKIHRHKLNQALEVMHECFAPCVDPVTHKDVAEDIIFNDQRDFYTVVLELQADEVVTVATVRVHGESGVAEVPLVATATKFQRQGMCKVLMDEIENWLRGTAGVERIVLPSAESALKTWTSDKMGFSIMREDEIDDLFDANGDIVDFQDTTMCQKQLVLQLSSTLNKQKNEKCNAADFASDDDDDASTISHEEHHVCISAADRSIKLRQAHISYY